MFSSCQHELLYCFPSILAISVVHNGHCSAVWASQNATRYADDTAFVSVQSNQQTLLLTVRTRSAYLHRCDSLTVEENTWTYQTKTAQICFDTLWQIPNYYIFLSKTTIVQKLWEKHSVSKHINGWESGLSGYCSPSTWCVLSKCLFLSWFVQLLVISENLKHIIP